MKILFSFFTLVFLLNHLLAAQENHVANKLFHVEFFGPGRSMSANFDGRFQSGARTGLGYRLGAGFGTGDIYINGIFGSNYGDRDRRTVYSFPAEINYVLGKPNRSSFFELGAGLSILSRKVPIFSYDADKPRGVIGYFSFMYRMMPVDGGIAFRAGLTPIFGSSGDLMPLFAVGFGYAF